MPVVYLDTCPGGPAKTCLACTPIIERNADRLVRKYYWWTMMKAYFMLPCSLALNVFSVVTNVVNLPARNRTEEYNLARHIVFLFELIIVAGALALMMKPIVDLARDPKVRSINCLLLYL